MSSIYNMRCPINLPSPKVVSMKHLKYVRIALHIASIVLNIFAIGYVLGHRTSYLAEECE